MVIGTGSGVARMGSWQVQRVDSVITDTDPTLGSADLGLGWGTQRHRSPTGPGESMQRPMNPVACVADGGHAN